MGLCFRCQLGILPGLWLGLPGSGLFSRSKLEPWGASSGRSNVGMIIIAAIVALAIIATVVIEAQ